MKHEKKPSTRDRESIVDGAPKVCVGSGSPSIAKSKEGVKLPSTDVRRAAADALPLTIAHTGRK
jgi:hypothetical protein